MRNRPDWMTNTDVLILTALGASDLIGVLSPSIIAYNLGMSREHASRRLAELSETEYVTKIEDGKYELSQKGRQFLSGNPNSPS
jgi:DNA-binding IclR family transcriptional regulator